LILSRLKRFVGTSVKGLCARCVHWTKPLSSSLPLETFADLGRSKSELIAENALLRQQLIILKRQVKRPVCTNRDRIFLVLLARAVRVWKQALFLVQAENISRDHCLEKARWRRKIAVFGAERIRAELLKLGLRVCKRTVQKYRRSAHGSLLSIPFCLLPHRTQDTPSGSCRRFPIPDRSLGCRTSSGSHSLWASTEVPDV
jgi:putative transposase